MDYLEIKVGPVRSRTVKWNSVDIVYKNSASRSQKTHVDTTKNANFNIMWAEFWQVFKIMIIWNILNTLYWQPVEFMNVQPGGP
jgi:hypothetical protein